MLDHLLAQGGWRGFCRVPFLNPNPQAPFHPLYTSSLSSHLPPISLTMLKRQVPSTDEPNWGFPGSDLIFTAPLRGRCEPQRSAGRRPSNAPSNPSRATLLLLCLLGSQAQTRQGMARSIRSSVPSLTVRENFSRSGRQWSSLRPIVGVR